MSTQEIIQTDLKGRAVKLIFTGVLKAIRGTDGQHILQLDTAERRNTKILLVGAANPDCVVQMNYACSLDLSRHPGAVTVQKVRLEYILIVIKIKPVAGVHDGSLKRFYFGYRKTIFADDRRREYLGDREPDMESLRVK